MTTTTNSLPESRGRVGLDFDASPTVASKRDGAHGAGEAHPPRGLSGAAVNPLVLVATFLDAAIATELQTLRTQLASLAAEYESLRDPLLGAPLIDASRFARALRGLLGEAGA